MDFLCLNLAFIEGLGGGEMVLILAIVLVLFGGDKLPGFARGLGKSIREFKKAASGVEEEFKRALEEDEHKKSVAAVTTKEFPPYPAVENHIAPPPVIPAIEAATSTPSTSVESIDAHSADSMAPHHPPSLEAPVTPAPVAPPAKTEPPKPGLTEHLP